MDNKQILGLLKDIITTLKDNPDIMQEISELLKNIQPPQIIQDLIEAGQLEKKPINGKYKPIFEITIFMEWLFNSGYEDYLNFNFFKKFIFYKNKDNSIKQYLKPCNYGVKRQKKKKSNDFVMIS
jgi:hypothetical protein